MGISNTIPPSRLIQPGVCTSSTRPTTPFEGQAIFETDTDRMYIWNGTAWVIPNSPAQNPSGLELVKQQTIGNNVTSIVVADAFSAVYDNYRILISKTLVSGVGDSAYLKLNNSTGSTYSSNGFYMTPSSNTVNGLGLNQLSVGFWLGVSGNTMSHSLDIFSPFLASITNVVGQSAGSGASGYNNGFISSDTNAASSTGFTIVQGTLNWTGGVISVYGYRK